MTDDLIALSRMPTVMLAIDPGISTGIAFGGPAGPVQFFTWALKGRDGARLFHLTRLLDDLYDRYIIERIAFEQPFSGRYAATIIALSEIVGAIKEWAERKGIPCAGYSPREIKCAVATGGAGKATIIQRVHWLGHKAADDHQADAVALLLLMRAGVAPADVVRKDAVKARRKAIDLFTPKRKTRGTAA